MPDLVHSFTHNFTLSSVTPSCYHWDSYLKRSKAGVVWLHSPYHISIHNTKENTCSWCCVADEARSSPTAFPQTFISFIYFNIPLFAVYSHCPVCLSSCSGITLLCIWAVLLNAAPWSWRNNISLYTLYRGMIIKSCLIDLHTLVWQMLLSNVLEPVVGSELSVLFAWASSSPSIFT